MRKILMPGFDLQLFAEGGGDGGSGTGAPGAAAETAAPATPQKGSNPLADVVYGKQAAEVPVAEEQPDLNAEFDALIKGKYKGQYEQRIKDTVKSRLKGNEETVNRYNQLTPVLELLASKYGVDANDVTALSKAIEDDEAFYEDEAIETGLTVQQVKEMRRIKRENAALTAQIQAKNAEDNANQQYAQWMAQAEEVKAIYPSFDLQADLANEQFRLLLSSGVPIRTAFEVLHKDEIIPAAMQYTAQQVAQKMANNIAAGKNRPSEGAMGNRSAVITKSDVSQLSKADRDEIVRRVARGEKIRF